MTGHQVFT